MSSFATFDFEGQTLSILTDDKGRDWFRGTDVCQILKISNPSVVIRRVAFDYSREWQDGVGRPALYVSDPGLYALIFESKTEEARRFQRCVFEDILPTIRKNGGYIASDATSEQLEALKFQIAALQEERERLSMLQLHTVDALNESNVKLKQQNTFIAEKLEEARTQAKINAQSVMETDQGVPYHHAEFLKKENARLTKEVNHLWSFTTESAKRKLKSYFDLEQPKLSH